MHVLDDGAGMWGQYTILPTTVSFSGCEFQEEKCPSTDPTGYFDVKGMTIWHNPDGNSDDKEPPDTNPTWIPIQDDNTAGDLDKAEAGPLNFLTIELYDEFGPAGFTWNIPLHYRCVGDSDDGVAFPSTVFTIMQISGEFGSYLKKGTLDGSDSVTGP